LLCARDQQVRAQVGKGKAIYGLRKDEGDRWSACFAATKHGVDPRRREQAVPQRGRRHNRLREEGKTIGALFIDVVEAEAWKVGGARFRAQARSIRGDRVGRLHRQPAGIKSHHNTVACRLEK
jgi:GMP synthase PP-ATPase subunit